MKKKQSTKKSAKEQAFKDMKQSKILVSKIHQQSLILKQPILTIRCGLIGL